MPGLTSISWTPVEAEQPARNIASTKCRNKFHRLAQLIHDDYSQRHDLLKDAACAPIADDDCAKETPCSIAGVCVRSRRGVIFLAMADAFHKLANTYFPDKPGKRSLRHGWICVQFVSERPRALEPTAAGAGVVSPSHVVESVHMHICYTSFSPYRMTYNILLCKTDAPIQKDLLAFEGTGAFETQHQLFKTFTFDGGADLWWSAAFCRLLDDTAPLGYFRPAEQEARAVEAGQSNMQRFWLCRSEENNVKRFFRIIQLTLHLYLLLFCFYALACVLRSLFDGRVYFTLNVVFDILLRYAI